MLLVWNSRVSGSHDDCDAPLLQSVGLVPGEEGWITMYIDSGAALVRAKGCSVQPPLVVSCFIPHSALSLLR